MNMYRATRSEDTEQTLVIEWAQWNTGKYPELSLLHHIPNGGSRNRLEAVKLKRMGVKAGVPDLHLPAPKGKYCGLYIEMKYGSGRIQDTQKAFMKDAASRGNYCVVCYGAQAAIEVLENYLRLKRIDTGEGETEPKVPNLSIVKEGKVKKI